MIRWAKYPLENPRRVGRQWTPRKRAAAARAVQRDAEQVPLFPELRRYGSVDDRVAEIDRNSFEFCTRMRAHRAQDWRRARAELRGLPDSTKLGLVRYWAIYGGPADPSYLLGMLRRIRRGESPWSWLRERRQLVLAGKARRAAEQRENPARTPRTE